MCPKSRINRLNKARRLVNVYKKKVGRASTSFVRRRFSLHSHKRRLKIGRTIQDESIRGKQVVILVYPRKHFEQFFVLNGITISTHDLTQAQIQLFKDMERRGGIPPITWIESVPSTVDDKIRLALLYLHGEEAKKPKCQMQKGYDYAWIKMALDYGSIPSPYHYLKSMSTPTYVEYIQSLGFKDIAGSKTLNKFIAKSKWVRDANAISFRGFPVAKPECDRRNNIALKFLEIVNEI